MIFFPIRTIVSALLLVPATFATFNKKQSPSNLRCRTPKEALPKALGSAESASWHLGKLNREPTAG